MKVVMTLLVRDEQDLLCAHLLYHLERGIDLIIATDNNSVDATTEILREFEARGVLHLIREPADDYEQAKWVTRMARMAFATFGADWVVHSDADEFWWPWRADLKSVLRGVPKRFGVVAAPRRNFVARPEQADLPFFERLLVRESESHNILGQPLPPKIAHRGYRDAVVGQGNHQLLNPPKIAVCSDAPLEILHFPMRSYAQFENKIAKGGAAYERNAALRPGIGATWRRLYRLWREGGLPGWYAARVPTEGEMDAGLAAGRLVVDTRLRDFLRGRVPTERERRLRWDETRAGSPRSDSPR